MTDDERAEGGGGRPWWYGGAEGLPDVESLLGAEGMEAVGGVAEEALKLFVVLRDRVNESGIAAPPAAAGGWGAVMGQLASGAVRAVNDLAAASQQSGAWQAEPAAPPSEAPNTVAPGQAASCAYCPICQAIALFRSVPMPTWQRLAASVVDAADAARDAAAASAAPAPVVVAAPAGDDPVETFLGDFDLP